MKDTRTRLAPYLFIFPNILIVLVFAIYPLISNVLMSFTDGPVGISNFIGFDNYINILKDKTFRISLQNTWRYSLLLTVPTVMLSLLLAVALNQIRALKGTLRAFFLLPHLFSWVVVGLIWRWMYSTNYGILNGLLESFGFRPSRWILNPKLTIPCLAFTGIWAGIGYYMVIFLAGLQGISAGLYEAAQMDGANAVQQFMYITIPEMTPMIILVVNLVVISSFRVFDQVYVMTGGGPGRASMVMVLYIYMKGMQEGKLGYASALSVIFFAVLMVLTLVLKKLTSIGER